MIGAWAIINIMSGLMVAAIVCWKLGGYQDQFNIGERIGMGMIASGMLLRIGPIVGRQLDRPSPFDDWSVLLLHVGLAVYFGARVYRLRRHWYRNHQQKLAAREWFGEIGR